MNKKTFNSQYSKTFMFIKLRRHLIPMYEIIKKFRDLELNFAPNETCSTADFDKLREALVVFETALLEVKEKNR